MRRYLIVLAVLLALFAAPAMGKAKKGFYIAGSVGQSSAKFEEADGDFDFDDSDNAWKLFVGYRLLGVLAFEGGYRDFGKIENTIFGSSLEIETTAWDVEALGIIPIGPVDIFGKFGGAFVENKGTVTEDGEGPLSESVDNWEIMYGIGVNVRIKGVGIRGEIEAIDSSELSDLYMWSIGVSYTF